MTKQPMLTRKITLTLCSLFIHLFAFSQTDKLPLPLLPEPNFMQVNPGNFYLSDTTVIVADENLNEAIILRDYLEKNYKIHVRIDPHFPPFKNYILFLTPAADGAEHNQEAYDLSITKKGITIKAFGIAGSFYGVQSLLQLLPLEFTSKRLALPCVQIFDAPKFSYRGMHLDCCRHFFTKDEIKRYLDLMAMYKFNTFHWHLTDDQGWRIQIQQYPFLTTTGAYRKQTLIGKPSSKNKYDHQLYGGYYSQDDIREIVAYASLRHITIVPEIEMPGHALAALAAYPAYSCKGGPFDVGDTWGVYPDVFCAGNDSTFQFLENILDEVCTLFPGKYIHIGGDECEKDRWKTCPKCQRRIKEDSLKDENGLQSYFIRRIEKYVNAKGKQIIGWDEILDGGLAPNATVMSWRGTKGGIDAANQNHRVIMTPGKPCYFDHYQSREKTKEPLAIGGYNPVDSVYNFTPIPAALQADKAAYIIGAQGNVWTEYILNFKQVEYMAVPRMIALSEALWTNPENKNYTSFVQRFRQHSVLLDRLEVNYAKHILK